MADLWGVLGALAAVALPLGLAWWLLGRPPRGPADRPPAHGKMPSGKER